MNHVTAEEKQRTCREFNRLAAIYDELAPPGDHLQVFVAGLMEMRRNGPVNAEQAGTGGGLIGEPHVEEHGVGG